MTNLILNVWSNESFTLKLIVALIVIVGVVLLYIKYSDLRPLMHIGLILVVLFFGITTTIENVTYLSVNNMTIGEVFNSTFGSINYFEEEEPGEFKINNFGFKNVEGYIYQATFKQPAITSLDFENQEYVLYVNGNKCYLSDCGEDYLSAEFTYAFYDENLDLITIDTLTINIALNANESTIVIQTSGGLNATELWKAYQVKNNFVLKFEPAAAEDFNFIDIEGGLDNGNMA